MKERTGDLNAVVGFLSSIAQSLSGIDSTLNRISENGLKLSSSATDAFTDAMGSGQLDGLLSAFTGRGTTSTSDVSDVVSAIRGATSGEGPEAQSASDLIASLNEAKDRLASINTVLGDMKTGE